MTIFEVLDREARARGLAFLVIGGHAVNAYGYSRETADVDLLVRKDERAAWTVCLESLGYRLFHDGGTFLQFSSSEVAAWPLDMMLVNGDTFSRMWAEAVDQPAPPSTIRVPCVEHLIALKLHTLKQRKIHRYLKDFQDVVGLIECCRLDPRSEKIKTIFEKYGNAELYGQVLRALS